MKIAGLDVGQARIGIAISDEMEILASSVESYHCKGDIETDARAVSEKLIELGAQKIVIGLPKNMNGTEGPAAEKCRDQNHGNRLLRHRTAPLRLWGQAGPPGFRP